MKQHFHLFLCIICAFLSANTVWGQFDTTYWYSYGLPDYYVKQPDVMAFKAVNGAAYTGLIDTNAVDTIVYQGDRRDKANEVYFKPTATLSDIQSQLQLLYASGELEMLYPTITRNPYLVGYMNGWYIIDDLVLVNFVNPYVTQLEVDSFMLRWDLSPYHQPDLGNLPVGGNYTYIFRVNLPARSNYGFIETAREMFLQEQGFVQEASPNIVNLPMGESVSLNGSGNPSVVPPVPCNNGFPDEYYYEQWYIDNPGNWTFSASGMPNDVSTFDADADICDCWAAGLSGQGINIAVLGDGGYDFNTPDLANKFVGQWDCTVNPCVPVINITIAATGYEMCLVIAAEENTPNSQFNTENIVGVAYNSTVTPIRVSSVGASGSQTSLDILVRAYELTLSSNVTAAVVATTFFSTLNNAFLSNAMNDHVTLGRGGKGTILIAHTGFNTFSPAPNLPTYPASYFDQVLSVTSSDPNDELHGELINPDWAAAGSTNYGSQYDIAVPGTPIYIGSTGNQGSYGNYNFKTGSGSVGIAAGIAAMLLQFNSNLTYTQMINLFRQGAEKVGGYTYNIPGTTAGAGSKSNEFGYGRVSCKNMINATVAIEQSSYETAITINENPFDNTLNFKWFNSHYEEIEASLWDIKGTKVVEKSFQVSNSSYEITTSHLAAGVYTLRISAKGNVISNAVKVIKLP